MKTFGQGGGGEAAAGSSRARRKSSCRPHSSSLTERAFTAREARNVASGRQPPKETCMAFTPARRRVEALMAWATRQGNPMPLEPCRGRNTDPLTRGIVLAAQLLALELQQKKLALCSESRSRRDTPGCQRSAATYSASSMGSRHDRVSRRSWRALKQGLIETRPREFGHSSSGCCRGTLHGAIAGHDPRSGREEIDRQPGERDAT